MVWFLSFLGRKSKSPSTRSTPVPQECRAPLNPQNRSSSGLFDRLPFEIRRMIYVYTLGGNLLHLTRKTPLRILKHQPFLTTQPASHHYSIVGETDPYHILCLLQTCRQIYADASPVLYSTNTFKVSGVYDLLLFREFPRQIRKDHLEMITSICINTQVDGYTSNVLESSSSNVRREAVFLNAWTPTCEVLATQMLGLKDLEIHLIKMYFPPLKLTFEQDWVRPMLKIRGLRRFEFDIAQGIGSEESTAEYNEKLEWFQKELRTSMCSAK